MKIIVGMIIGAVLAWHFHPYEQCARMYNSPEYISECVWIKENP